MLKISSLCLTLLFFCIRLNGQVAVRVGDSRAEVLKIIPTIANSSLSDQIWIGTGEGLFLLQGGDEFKLQLISTKEAITSLFAVRDQVWYTTSREVFKLNPSGEIAKVAGIGDIVSVVALDDRIWFASGSQVFRYNAGTGVLSSNDLDSPISAMISVSNGGDRGVWVGGADKLYHFSGKDGEVPQPEHIQGSITSLAETRFGLWIGTDRGLYSHSGTPIGPDFPGERVEKILEANQETWLISGEKVYVAGLRKNFNKDTYEVSFRENAFDCKLVDALFLPGNVIGSLEKPKSVQEGGSGKDSPLGFRTSLGEVWGACREGLYKIDLRSEDREGRVERVLPLERLHFNSLSLSSGKRNIWVATKEGAYRIDRDVFMDIRIFGESSWWRSVMGTILPGFYVSGQASAEAIYKRNTSQGVPVMANGVYTRYGKIKCQMEIDNDKKFDDERRLGDATTSLGYRPLPAGRPHVRVFALDQWGNLAERSVSLTVFPGPVVTGSFVALGWLASLVLVIVFAPYKSMCNVILMNREIRKYGYFGLVPIVLSIMPPVRYHVLRRYVGNMKGDSEIMNWLAKFIVISAELDAKMVLEKLRDGRRIFVLGDSGAGKTSLCRYLAASYVSGFGAAGRVFPVYLPLARYKNSDPMMMFCAQMAGRGGITDEGLAGGFLDRGGFILMFDGLNEVSLKTRQAIGEFVDRHVGNNYFLLSSQELYEEFSSAPRIEIKPLSDSAIESFLHKELGGERADAVIGQLTPKNYYIYRNPQDLESAIRVLLEDSNASLPSTRNDLYQRLFKPIWQRWEGEGKIALSEVLTKRAYDMVAEGERVFDNEENPLPPEIRNELLKGNLVARRVNGYYFRHEQILAFLASLYFWPRWKDLLAQEGVRIDIGWLSMLRFSVELIDDINVIQEMLDNLLIMDRRVAVELFSWARSLKPSFGEDWVDKFERSVGKSYILGPG